MKGRAYIPTSLGIRWRLSDSDEVDRWISDCDRSDDPQSVDEGVDEGAVGGGELSEERGESQAVEALEDLKCVVTLGLQMAACLPFNTRAILVSLLMAICVQELVLLGVYSTPAVELERQRTLDFILEKGQKEVAQLEACGQSCSALRRLRKMLPLMQHIRNAPSEPNPTELGVEATISHRRVVECKWALQQLKPWIEGSIPTPRGIVDKVLQLLAFARRSGKGRVTANNVTYSWLDMVQQQVNFAGIAKPREDAGTSTRMAVGEQLDFLSKRYGRLSKALTHSIQSALSDTPLEEPRQEHHQQDAQQLLQNQNIVHQQQHQWTNHPSNINPGPSSILQPLAEQPPAQTAG
ncbi:hypothetical protein EMWEY_00059220, partial [Eimeria maxima]